MAARSFPDKLRVYLETPDGKMMELDTITAEVGMKYEPIDVTYFGGERSYIPGLQTTELRLVGNGPITWTEGKEFMNQKKSAKEWVCEFCGNVNPREARYCGHKNKHAVGCGAQRSFVYD